jgi:DNA-binding CsgD family transcriptional regulator
VSAQLLAKLRREYVRQAIRDGKTIAQIRAEYGVSQRFIEDERKALAALDGSVPDSRTHGLGEQIAQLLGAGATPAQIASQLGCSRANVHHHRRKIKKVK